jgi:Tol biopolymer transport system component
MIWSLGHYRNLDMTPDGRFIVFVAYTNSNSYIYLWDGQTAATTLVSCDTNNAMPTNSVCDWPAVDSSGRFVAFLSSATTLTTNIVTGDFHLYLRDRQAGTTTLLDADPNGAGFPKDLLNPVRLTPDGRYAAFDCTEEYPATNIYNQAYNFAGRSLVPNDNNHAFDVFLRDLTTNTIELISVRQPALPSQTPAGSSAAAIFSVDTAGRYIAFASAADSLVPNFTNKYRAVFVHDLLGGTNLLVSVDINGLANANGMSSDPSISGDGHYVVFTSSATNLAAVVNSQKVQYGAQDVFVRDLQAGTTTLVSVNASPNSYINSYSPVISANGRYVLFRSTANIATTNSYTSVYGSWFANLYMSENLFLQNLQAGTTCALTTSINSSVNGVYSDAITPDGHFVAFYGYSAFNGVSSPYLYVWDSQAGATIYTNTSTGTITSLAISPDGNRIVYSTSGGFYAADRAANANWLIAPSLAGLQAGPQFSGDARFLVYSTTSAQVALDTNRIADVYLYDFVTRSNFLVSQGNLTGAPNGPSDSPAISPDGRFVAFRSFVTNIISGVTNSIPNVFLYDRQTGINTLLSANASGTTGNNRSLAPMFSGDGQTVVFQSWASDLMPQDYNQANDMVAVKIATSNPTPVFVGQMVFAPASRQSPTLTWPAALGATYQVQFKNNLTDAAWQPLSGNTWVAGNQGYATDLAPNAGQRFYRVVTF